MVKKILNFLHKEYGGLHRAAVILAGSSIASGLLGLARDRLLAGTFGASQTLDIYYAAFKIPDLLYIVSLSIASVTVLIPFFMERNSVSPADGKKFLDNIFTIFLLLMVVLVVFVFFAAPKFSHLVAPGFSEESNARLVLLVRILLLSPFLLGLSNLLSTVVQSFNRFFIYALSPILYNLGIIFGILFLYPILGLSGIVWGVVLGALAHAAIQIPSIIKLGFMPVLRKKLDFIEAWQVVKLSLPRTLGLMLNQIVFVFITAVASLIGVGSIAIFNLSFNLQSVPLSVIGASYSVAAFPTLVRFFVNNEKKKFLEHTVVAMRQIIFWSIPVSFLLIVLRAQIVRVLFGYGEFGWRDTRLTAACLALFAVSITAQALVILFARAFYAAGKTMRPIIVNTIFFFFIIIGICLSMKLIEICPSVKYFFETLLRVRGVEGGDMLILPLLFSLGMILNAVFLCKIFERDFGPIWPFAKRTFSHVILASLLMGVIVYFSLNIMDRIFDIKTFIGIFFQGFVSAIFGIGAWFVVLSSAKNEELQELTAALKSKLWKTPTAAPEPEELP